jgi:DNA mismatch endonuclease (patch repair protein)
MADTFSQARRSQIMASIRSTGNASTERSVAAALRTARITGWRRHVLISLPAKPNKQRCRTALRGQRVCKRIRPDFVFRAHRVAVFVDGCFWHGCEKHSRIPKSHVEYWRSKIRRNRLRDKQTARLLSGNGWKVVRIWEHDVESSVLRCINTITRALHRARVSNTR